MKTRLLSLFTHDRLIVRFITAELIGAVILFAAWLISDAWLPEKHFLLLPGFAISPIKCDIGSVAETVITFRWNLVLTGGLCIFASSFNLIKKIAAMGIEAQISGLNVIQGDWNSVFGR